MKNEGERMKVVEVVARGRHLHDVAMSQASFSLRRDSAGQLWYSDSVTRDLPVVLTPAFPLSEPGRWLSLRAGDGSEQVLIKDVGALPSELADVLQEELQSRQFVPVITQVHRVSSVTTGLEVAVDTDHGPTTLILDADEHIRRVSETCMVLTDRAGVRYLIPNLRELDQESRHRLERFY